MVVCTLSPDEVYMNASATVRFGDSIEKQATIKRKQDTSVDAASHLYFHHDCIHPTQVENKELDMARAFFLFFFVCVCFSTDSRGPNGTQSKHKCQ